MKNTNPCIARKILIRADASSQMGAGHLMRMLALSQLILDSGHDVYFATVPYSPPLLEYLKAEPLHLHRLPLPQKSWDSVSDLESLLAYISKIQPDWVVLDGYQFSEAYEYGIKQQGLSLLRVDDIPSMSYSADVLLNQNHGAEQMEYDVHPNTRLLTGLKYLLLRREFRKALLEQKIFSEEGPFHILISLGGGSQLCDSLNLKMLQAFSQLENWKGSATIIVGKMGTVSEQLTQLLTNISWQIEVLKQSDDMASEILKSDLAIVAGGSTMWELMSMQVPFLALSLTEAQRDYLRFLEQEGLCDDLGWHEQVTPEKILTSLLSLLQNVARRRQMLETANRLLCRERNGEELLRILSTDVRVSLY